MTESLTPQEVASMLSSLQIDDRQNLPIGLPRLEYLNSLIEGYLEVVPVQSAFLVSVAPEKRRQLTWDEIKHLNLTLQGGFCQVMNVFFMHFLRALGFEVNLLIAHFYNLPSNHSVIIARNVENPGDRFIVDVGSGQFMLALSLSFEERTEIQDNRFLTTFFQWESSEKTALSKKRIGSDNEEVIHIQTIDLTREFTSLADLITAQNPIYTDSYYSPFLTTIRYQRFPRSNQESIAILGKELLIASNGERLMKNAGNLTTVELFQDAVRKYFPTVSITEAEVTYRIIYGEEDKKSKEEIAIKQSLQNTEIINSSD